MKTELSKCIDDYKNRLFNIEEAENNLERKKTEYSNEYSDFLFQKQKHEAECQELMRQRGTFEQEKKI